MHFLLIPTVTLYLLGGFSLVNNATKVLIAILVALLIMLGQLFWNIKSQQPTTSPAAPDYHFQIIVEDTSPSFSSLLYQGAKRASNEENIYVEFITLEKWGTSSLTDTVKTGIYSNVDGIAMQCSDPSINKELHSLAKANNVELLIYESEDLQNQGNLPQVGSNTYSVGIKAGELAIESIGNSDESYNAVLILDTLSPSGTSQFRSMKNQGLIETLEDTPNIEMSQVYTLEDKPYAAERLIDKLLEDNDDINMIICLDDIATPLLAQRIVDKNLVGKVKVIGSGTHSKTISYIQRGVIYGVVNPDSYDIGYQIVTQLKLATDNQPVSDYTPVPLQSITKSNVNRFVQLESAKEGNTFED